MPREIITTADGSKTIYMEEWEEYYHSMHGAVQESYHVFIKHGLAFFEDGKKEIAILEIGFGTGLNAFITCIEAEKRHLQIAYEGIEAYPVTAVELEALNYTEVLSAGNSCNVFDRIHRLSWENSHQVSPHFILKKRKQLFFDIKNQSDTDLIYFDAFSARVQPELWGEAMFLKMFNALKPGGILVTYSAKGMVRRTMQKVGFAVERLPGPPGKREMLRASKLLGR